MASSDYTIQLTTKQAICAIVVLTVVAGFSMSAAWFSGFDAAKAQGAEAIASCVRILK